jgi:poly(3-hydroxybutyrate) depolymerase
MFTVKLLDYLEDNYCIDRRRMHVSGMSNGGMMAFQAGVSLSSRFASMIPVAGSALLGFWTVSATSHTLLIWADDDYTQPPKSPIALMDIHGTMDDTIPANRSNGFKWPVIKGPHGTAVSSDGM